MKIFIKRLKNYFLAGLIAILPFWATFFILLTVFRIIASVAKPYLEPIPYLSSFPLLLEVVSFLGTTLTVVLLGVLLTNVLGRRIFLWFDRLVQNLPILTDDIGLFFSNQRTSGVVHNFNHPVGIHQQNPFFHLGKKPC